MHINGRSDEHILWRARVDTFVHADFYLCGTGGTVYLFVDGNVEATVSDKAVGGSPVRCLRAGLNCIRVSIQVPIGVKPLPVGCGKLSLGQKRKGLAAAPPAEIAKKREGRLIQNKDRD